jgi:hypothetical protein
VTGARSYNAFTVVYLYLAQIETRENKAGVIGYFVQPIFQKISASCPNTTTGSIVLYDQCRD